MQDGQKRAFHELQYSLTTQFGYVCCDPHLEPGILLPCHAWKSSQ